ncbi:PstS family phosphate ABC transporter substrate-binding protein [Parabacteroides provencensis]|uniref:PstS family phosphate ABC transporter substrate-binding protein n=1 Tax=Parabacteroides provencensis TaxID=1944636 RepID=UPI000C15CEC2|nr:substrate-binding domain-containing protein [Parabacteroides provencensis]
MKQVIVYYMLCTLLLVSCSNKRNDEAENTPTSGTVEIAADECFSPIIDEEIAVFESLYKEAGIIPHYSGETEAINLLLNDSVWMAITSRPLTDQETNYMNNKKLFPRTITVAYDAIALIVNRQNPDSLIGLPVLKDIFTGKISNWNEIGTGNKTGHIEVVFDNPNSSTVRYAIDSICQGKQLSGKLHAANSNKTVIRYVADHPGALGIIGVNWIGNPADSTGLSFKEDITVMSVSRYRKATNANSFKPYQAYMALNDYPMTRPVYIILSEPRNGLASGFTSFLTSDKGQRIILKSGLLPATQPVRMVNVRDEL